MNSTQMRAFLRLKSYSRPYLITEWHAEVVRMMSAAATEHLGKDVSQNAVVKAAIDMLAINFDPQMFEATRSPSTEKQVQG